MRTAPSLPSLIAVVNKNDLHLYLSLGTILSSNQPQANPLATPSQAMSKLRSIDAASAAPQPAAADNDPPRGEGSPRVISSEALLAGSAQLAILHKQTIYFLRQTRFGRLILTK